MLSKKDFKDLSITPNLIDENLLSIQMEGFFDMYSAELFKNYMLHEVLENWDINVALDCKELKHISSTGFLTLIYLEQKLKAMSRNLYLVNVSNKLRDVIELLGFSKIILCRNSIIEVMAELDPTKLPNLQS